ncbi:MAG: helix-turn-helix transcriptional regulator [Hyphomicrobium sp.]
MESPIKKLRHDLGLSRGELAKALGENYSYLAALERGEYNLPPRLAEGLLALGVDPEALAANITAFRADQRNAIIKRTKRRLGTKTLISEAKAGAKS